ncbi:hypothetical protein GSI_12331 [Ganoderma sinense ZZ0214-1]|uniref:Uncharacterized protein n=1 Tax=Ganoderma sinense ZZ0214-1 TaxID=1077348 RepID=A0A2G8RYH5_9APHY|nr:hypothetical protein GSI_12331 [Ganoderma sinense ZZ0214-1]
MIPYTVTAEFTQAVDNLIQDSSVLDAALHSRAQQYLEVFNESSSFQVQHGPAWAERIYRASPHLPLFTSLGLFNAMYLIADELGLGAGKRVKRGRQRVWLGPSMTSRRPVTWAAFVLWPFYAFANRDTTYSEGCRHTTSHVTFVDHSVTNVTVPGAGVDLPDRELLRVHAALAGMLDHSGVCNAFVLLRYRSIHVPGVRFSAYPEPSGGAFWKSVVEYEGPEVCLEVEVERGEEDDGSNTETERETVAASASLPPSLSAAESTSCAPDSE